MITIDNLAKKYGNNLVLTINNFSTSDSEVIGLVGNNGAGKTTLLNIIAGRIAPSSGVCLVDGKDTYKNLQCSDTVALIDEKVRYSGSQKLCKIIKDYDYNIDGFDAEKASKYMTYFNLDGNKTFRTLSKGMINIFNLIIGFSLPHKVILFDEITSGLDEFARRRFLTILTDEIITNPKVYILSTHLFDEISSVTEKVLLLHNKTIQLQENTDSLSDYLIELRGLKDILLPVVNRALVYDVKDFSPYQEVIIRNNLSRRERAYIEEKNIEVKAVSVAECCAIIANLVPIDNRRAGDEEVL